MKTNTLLHIALLVSGMLIVPMASAQVTGAARNAANIAVPTAASAAINATTAPAMSASAAAEQSAITANAAAQQAGTAANASANTAAGVMNGTTGVTAGAVDGEVGVANGNAGVRASTVDGETINTPAAHASAAVSGNAAASLDVQQTLQQIHNASAADRQQLAQDINARLQRTSQTIANLRSRGRRLTGNARRQFDTAYAQVRQSEMNLRNSLRDARQSTSQDWSVVQNRLSNDYQSFESAVLQVEAAAQASVSSS